MVMIIDYIHRRKAGMIINAKLMMLKINYSDAIGGCDDYNNNDDDDDNDNLKID